MYTELLENCILAASQGAAILHQYTGKIRPEQINEKGFHDFVTEVDKMSEDAIVAHIIDVYPDHSILAEEGGYRDQKSDFRWIIDPLDGTTNFIHSYPVFAVSVAVQHKNEIVAGTIIDVSRNDIYAAAKGFGSTLNGRTIKVSETTALDKSLILTGFPFKAQIYTDDFITVFRDLLPATAGIRRLGSAALDLAYVASGRADGFWEFGLSAWDIAAGALLVQEAGGVITDVDQGEDYLKNGHVICGNQQIYNALFSVISSHFEPGHFLSK